MKVYVIRHGQSEANLQERYAGWMPVPLSPLGRQQAEKARENLRRIPIDRVYCSDLARARETAQIVVPACQAEPTAALREIGVGRIEGMLCRECEERYGAQYFQCERMQDFSCFGGETGEEMRQRIHGFLRQLEQLEGVEHVAVIGHEGTVRETLNYALGQTVLLEHLQIDNASISVFDCTQGRWKLLQWNYTGEL